MKEGNLRGAVLRVDKRNSLSQLRTANPKTAHAHPRELPRLEGDLMLCVRSMLPIAPSTIQAVSDMPDLPLAPASRRQNHFVTGRVGGDVRPAARKPGCGKRMERLADCIQYAHRGVHGSRGTKMIEEGREG
jgi:hypothetical protein